MTAGSDSFATVERLLSYFEAGGYRHAFIEESTRFAGKILYSSDEHVLQKSGERSVTLHWVAYLKQKPEKGDYAVIVYPPHEGKTLPKSIDVRIIKRVR